MYKGGIIWLVLDFSKPTYDQETNEQQIFKNSKKEKVN